MSTVDLINFKHIMDTQISSGEELTEQNMPGKTRSSKFEKKHDSQAQKTKRAPKKLWKPVENRRYVEFLKRKSAIFQKSQEDKRNLKINILMSNYIKTKSSKQCRSHHQKMLEHYKTIEQIIVGIEEKIYGEIKMEVPKNQNSAEIESEIQVEKTTQNIEMWDVMDQKCWGYEQVDNAFEHCNFFSF